MSVTGDIFSSDHVWCNFRWKRNQISVATKQAIVPFSFFDNLISSWWKSLSHFCGTWRHSVGLTRSKVICPYQFLRWNILDSSNSWGKNLIEFNDIDQCHVSNFHLLYCQSCFSNHFYSLTIISWSSWSSLFTSTSSSSLSWNLKMLQRWSWL